MKCKNDLGDRLECPTCGWKYIAAIGEQQEALPEAHAAVPDKEPRGGLQAQEEEKKKPSEADPEGQQPKAEPEEKRASPASPPERNLRPAAAKPEKETPGSDATGEKKEPHSDAKADAMPEKKKGAPAEEKDKPSPHAHPGNDLPSAIKDLKGGQFVHLEGDEHVVGQVVNYIVNKYFQSERSDARVEDEVSLSGITAALQPREADVPDYDYEPEEIECKAKTLKEEHLILISCAHEKVALGAAYTLIDKLEITEGENRRWLNFDTNAQEKSDQSIALFFQKTTDQKEPTAIVVDTFNKASQAFLGWLTYLQSSGPRLLRQNLRNNNFWLICLIGSADFENIENRLRAEEKVLNFKSWKIPFLRPLLKHYFPEGFAELEEQIRRQQRQGKWKKDEASFCFEVRKNIENDQLLERLSLIEENRVELASDLPNVLSFKSDQPLHNTILYVATYFPDLAPHEFDYLVSLLVGDKTTTISVKSTVKNKEGESELIDVPVEKPLIHFWNEDPGKYLEECQLETVSRADATTAIDFLDSRLRENLKKHFEKKQSFYVLRQFQTAQNQGLLFHPSPRIVANMMRLGVEMAISYPDISGKNWLLKTIQDVRQHFDTDATVSHAASGPVWNIMVSTGVNLPKAKVYEHLAQLVRQMLEEPQLESTIDGFLKQLMSDGSHDSVLEILKRLQFAPRFNEFYWMKRLLDESDELTRQRTYAHLYNYIKKIGIYPLLSTLEAWLPKEEQPPATYSQTNLYALRLLVEYCSETIENFDPRYYGSRLSRHPLFTFEDATSTSENLNRLIKWLFHPGMESVFTDLNDVFQQMDFEDHMIPFICELVVEWIFVLEGRGEASAIGQRETASPPSGVARVDNQPAKTDSFIDAATVRSILIEELVRGTNRAQQNKMLTYWEQLRDFMAFVLSLRGESPHWIYQLDYQERKTVLWKRELIRSLIKRFRESIRKHGQSGQHNTGARFAVEQRTM